MQDLHLYVTEQYASQWERLGLLLGLQDYHIANISEDNKNNPNRSVTCCIAVLEKWLRTIPSPTWGKLENAINNLQSKVQRSDVGESTGIAIIFCCL